MNREKKTMDGNTAAATVAYLFSEMAPIYPITPSTRMAELMEKWSQQGRKNLWGREVCVMPMQSEAGVAGMLHGGLVGGLLASTFTSSQGLLLMIPNMFKIAGELLPAVIHVAARTIATHALSIFGDHSDVYSCRQTGFAMLAAGNVQEVMDFSAIAHLSAIKGSVPFLHFFDGFRTSHEIQKIEIWDEENLKILIDEKRVDFFRKRSSNPERPSIRGTAQNSDVFFQMREAQNGFYDKLPNVVVDYMNRINELVGTDYKLFNYYGDENATDIIVAMGSVCGVIEEVIDHLNSKGYKLGLVKVRLYRPFSSEQFLNVLPKTAERITVLDRVKEPGAVAGPLFLDIAAGVSGSEFAKALLLSGCYGLASKDVALDHIVSVFENSLARRKRFFTLGINDDVTHRSLPYSEQKIERKSNEYCCKFWGFGSDGTIGAIKSAVEIIGNKTNKFVQAYFSHDSKKSGGLTISHLRFGDNPIRLSCLIDTADFIACHKAFYLKKYGISMIKNLKPSGVFLINGSLDDLDIVLPNPVKKQLALNKNQVYAINASEIAGKLELHGKPGVVLQAAFMKLTKLFPETILTKFLQEAVRNMFGTKGEHVVQKNLKAVMDGMNKVEKLEIPTEWKDLPEEVLQEESVNGLDKILRQVEAGRGNEIPVSEFLPFADGVFPSQKSALGGLSPLVAPNWKPENCISCNICSLVCPHAAIRPVIVDDAEKEKAPKGMEFVPFRQYNFGITVSLERCRGCGICAEACPGRGMNKALKMHPASELKDNSAYFEFGKELLPKPQIFESFGVETIKGSQFKPSLLEFSGACAGCGETPYAKLATQLFGERMYIANATGCSSIWGASFPLLPYVKNQEGNGPAWANSLFEDNAEFGYGIFLAQKELRERLITRVEIIKTTHHNLVEEIESYLGSLNDAKLNAQAAKKLTANIDEEHCPDCSYVAKNKEYLSKKSVWIFGGDGWAYDIGFSGLDHVLASNADVNVLVFDTECYSNTGGQASKATSLGAVANFASSGKTQPKKDLAAMMMTYGSVYVAKVALSANYQQCLRAFLEAESYEGPSIIIAYAPCVGHGIMGGMKNAWVESKKAVMAGYWHLFRFDPRRKLEKQNPFVLDSSRPSLPIREFLSNEQRYVSAGLENLIPIIEQDIKEKYEELERKAKGM